MNQATSPSHVPSSDTDLFLQGSRPCHIRLREPAISQVLPLLLAPAERAPWQVRVNLMLEFQALMASIDGAYASETRILQLLDDPGTRAILLRTRRHLYETWPARGQLGAYCPHCDHAVQLSLAHYWLALRLPAWQFVDAEEMLQPPCVLSALADFTDPSEHIASSRKLWVRYPALEAEADPHVTSSFSLVTLPVGRDTRQPVLATLLAEARAQDDQERLPEALDPNGVAWRSMVAMAERLGLADAAGVLRVARMPLGAFFLCDLLYFAARHPHARDCARLRARCPQCAQDFSPTLSA
ncbi:MAG: hypothetical protein REI94_08725 [Moraxellaceae bacterium]|nr:hypothetical protein [Moraxellaceae bacterium]